MTFLNLERQERMDHKELTSSFILGPAYSGKSLFANSFINPSRSSCVLGTSTITEPHHLSQIQKLKLTRPTSCKSFNISLNLTEEAIKNSPHYQDLIIDSVNQWLGNLIIQGHQKYDFDQLEDILSQERTTLINFLQKTVEQQKRLIVVSSEAGSCPSPARAMDRIQRKYLGLINQDIAKIVEHVFLTQAGIPMKIK